METVEQGRYTSTREEAPDVGACKRDTMVRDLSREVMGTWCDEVMVVWAWSMLSSSGFAVSTVFRHSAHEKYSNFLDSANLHLVYGFTVHGDWRTEWRWLITFQRVYFGGVDPCSASRLFGWSSALSFICCLCVWTCKSRVLGLGIKFVILYPLMYCTIAACVIMHMAWSWSWCSLWVSSSSFKGRSCSKAFMTPSQSSNPVMSEYEDDKVHKLILGQHVYI